MVKLGFTCVYLDVRHARFAGDVVWVSGVDDVAGGEVADLQASAYAYGDSAIGLLFLGESGDEFRQLRREMVEISFQVAGAQPRVLAVGQFRQGGREVFVGQGVDRSDQDGDHADA